MKRRPDPTKPMTRQYNRVMADAAAIFRDREELTPEQLEQRMLERAEKVARG